jgi:quinol-cytochrome oxidoreductase complex cytochrome b subunit
MNFQIPLYIVSIILAVIGIPTLLVLVYLSLIDSGISSKFFWTASIVSCILSILFFSLARILVTWKEEDEREEE